MPTKVAPPATCKITSEVFTVGKFGDDLAYDVADLDAMVRSFNDYCAGDSPRGWKVPLVLGHDEPRTFDDVYEGTPNCGVMTKLWRKGESLWAEFDGVPLGIGRKVNAGQLPAVSVEVFGEVKFNDGTSVAVPAIRRVALIGSGIPRAKGMSPPVAIFAERIRGGNRITFRFAGRRIVPTIVAADLRFFKDTLRQEIHRALGPAEPKRDRVPNRFAEPADPLAGEIAYLKKHFQANSEQYRKTRTTEAQLIKAFTLLRGMRGHEDLTAAAFLCDHGKPTSERRG